MTLVEERVGFDAARRAMQDAQNDLFKLSIEAGGLTGLLRLIAGSTEHLDENKCMAFGVLADHAQRIENGIMAIHDRLNEDEAA